MLGEKDMVCMQIKKLILPIKLIDVPEHQSPVVQGVDNAIYQINHYPMDKCEQIVVCYPIISV